MNQFENLKMNFKRNHVIFKLANLQIFKLCIYEKDCNLRRRRIWPGSKMAD